MTPGHQVTLCLYSSRLEKHRIRWNTLACPSNRILKSFAFQIASDYAGLASTIKFMIGVLSRAFPGSSRLQPNRTRKMKTEWRESDNIGGTCQ